MSYQINTSNVSFLFSHDRTMQDIVYKLVPKLQESKYKCIYTHIYQYNVYLDLLLLGMSNRLKPYNWLLGQVSDRVPGYSVENLFCLV